MSRNKRLFAGRNHLTRLVKVVSSTLSGDEPQTVSGVEFGALGRRSKILLNVYHFDTPYFEWQRLMHFGFMQGAFVVTETATSVPALIPGQQYLEDEPDSLAELVGWLLDDAEGRTCAERVRNASHSEAMARFQLGHALQDIFIVA